MCKLKLCTDLEAQCRAGERVGDGCKMRSNGLSHHSQPAIGACDVPAPMRRRLRVHLRRLVHGQKASLGRKRQAEHLLSRPHPLAAFDESRSNTPNPLAAP